MEQQQFAVCRVLYSDKGLSYFAPVGSINGMARAIEFNKNNLMDQNNPSPYIAVYKEDFDQETLNPDNVFTTTEKVPVGRDVTFDSGTFYDSIKNVSATPVNLGGSIGTINPGEKKLVFLNEKLHTIDYGNLRNYVIAGFLKFYDEDVQVDDAKALTRLRYNSYIVRSFNREDVTGKIQWHQYVGQQVVTAFRKDLLRVRITPAQSAAVLTKMLPANMLMFNGQLEFGIVAFQNTVPDAIVTEKILKKYESYIRCVDYTVTL